MADIHTQGGGLWRLVVGLVGLALGPGFAGEDVRASASDPAAPGHKVQVNTPSLASAIVAQGGRLIADYGGFQLYSVPATTPALLSQPQVESRDEYNLIQLNVRALDTSKPETQALRRAAGDFTGKRLHLVQFAGPVQPAWREELAATGVQLVAYIPHNAYLVYGDAASIGRMQALATIAPYIQWDGAYDNDYKLNPRARLTDAQGNRRDIETDMFAVQLVADAAANAGTMELVEQLKLEAIKRHHSVLNYVNVVVRIAPENLGQLAARPDVISIQPYETRKKLCERQAQIAAGNLTGNVPSGPGYLAWLASKGFTQAQFTASGFAADITDSGIDNGTTNPNHPALHVTGTNSNPSRVVYTRLEGTPNNPGSSIAGCDGHGNLNTHIIGGYDNFPAGFPHTDAAGFHYGLGICPFVKLGSSVIFDPDFYTFPDFTKLQADAYQDKARVSNNSWGSSAFGAYDIDCQEYDALVRDAQPAGSSYPTAGNQEMVIIFSAGNDGDLGSETIGAPATAKNIIAVGTGESVQALGAPDGCGLSDAGANSANDLFFWSSRGPCSDLRHKPDIIAPGTHISGGAPQAPNPGVNGTMDPCFTGDYICGASTSLFFPPGQEWWTLSSGSSHSAPAVVGGCALIRQYFINFFSNAPSAAMTKAYLMNSARYLTGAYVNDTLFSDNQGMGGMNLGMAFDGTSRVLRDQDPGDLFTASGQTRTFSGQIATTSKPFRVTLAWTDAPGSTTGNAYNNNLDLTVVVAGIIFRGNVFSSSNSVPGGSADTRNNVESVFLPAGLSGDFTVTVTAANINSDGVPNNATPQDQDFALVIYNAVPPPPTISSIQPTNLTVLQNYPAGFTVTVSGPGPLAYQWLLNGTNISGATTSAYSMASAQPTDTGGYSVIVTNPYGAATSSVVALTVIPTVPLPFALNNSSLIWTSDTTSPWYGQTSIAHDGVAAAQTLLLGDGQQSRLRTVATGPGTLTFWWKVSSETNADILSLSYGGAQQAAISGEVDWQERTFFLPTGAQPLQWIYAKNTNASSGQDAAWVDEVNYTPGFTLPFVITPPTDQTSVGGTPVTFSVVAAGTPTLTYQWRFNGTNITGATTSAYTIGGPQKSDAGSYAVRVANAFGAITSSPAILGVLPLLVRGDNTFGQLAAVMGATNAIALAAGAWHSLALRPDGTVLAWGNNVNGQCDVPTNLTEVVAIAGGGYHSLALRANRSVVGWGADFYGQTVPPPTVSNLIAIAAGTWHSVGLRSDGTVVAWGDNTWGQTDVLPGLGNVMAIAAGGNHSLALRANGTVAAWGDNANASGTYAGQSVPPLGLTNVVAIGAGDYHSLAVRADGSLVIWGDNSQGQSQAPAGLGRVVGIVGGGSHSVAVQTNGIAAAWGNNWLGQCNIPNTISNVIGMAAGDSHTVLLLGSVAPGPQPALVTRSGSQFIILLQTFYGKAYTLEYKNTLTATNWTALRTIHGNGAMQFLVDPAATGAQRFYRIRQQ